MSDLPKRILGRKFLQALLDAGIIQHGDYVRRVVIDASVNDALVVHVERWGDERLLGVARTLAGVEVAREPATEADLNAQIQELAATNADLRRQIEWLYSRATEREGIEPS